MTILRGALQRNKTGHKNTIAHLGLCKFNVLWRRLPIPRLREVQVGAVRLQEHRNLKRNVVKKEESHSHVIRELSHVHPTLFGSLTWHRLDWNRKRLVSADSFSTCSQILISDDLKREVQAEVFDPVAVGKLLSNGYERDTIMSQAVQVIEKSVYFKRYEFQSLQESTTRKVIDLRYLNDKLSTPCDSDTLKNALLGIAFNVSFHVLLISQECFQNNCISPSASGSEKIQSELHNVIRHIKRKSFLPAFDKSKPLETRHFASETDFTKVRHCQKFHAPKVVLVLRSKQVLCWIYYCKRSKRETTQATCAGCS